MLAVMRNQHIGSLYNQKSKQHVHLPILKMHVKGASTSSGHENEVIG